MLKKTVLALLMTLCLSGMLLTSGCLLAAAGAGAGGVFYAKGDLEATLAATPSEIASATEKAFAELKIIKTSAASSNLDAEILGRSATDKKITVTSKAQGEKISAISIRVGTFGDKGLSQLIFDKIKRNLQN
ncbi:MAG: DUF3568 family protein [Phycisphaerae bacterium]|jgi:hypothetical protein|nr:DUF3568 family protein [Phycisphaerae bacterium]